MKNKRLVKKGLGIVGICGIVLFPSSPMYTINSYNKVNEVQAINSVAWDTALNVITSEFDKARNDISKLHDYGEISVEKVLNNGKEILEDYSVYNTTVPDRFYMKNLDYPGEIDLYFKIISECKGDKCKFPKYTSFTVWKEDYDKIAGTRPTPDGYIGDEPYVVLSGRKILLSDLSVYGYPKKGGHGVTTPDNKKEFTPVVSNSKYYVSKTGIKPGESVPSIGGKVPKDSSSSFDGKTPTKPTNPSEDKEVKETSFIKGVSRLSGRDRYKTNLAITKRWDKADTIVVCNGRDFPDALSASPLAKKYNAPLMLVDGNKLTAEQESEIARLGVKKAYIIGSEGVMKNTIVSQLKNRGVTSTTRLGGHDRYETCSKIADQIGYSKGVVVVNGTNFPDALSVAPVAAKKQMPILLVQKDHIPSVIKGLLSKIPSNKQNYVIGSTGVISDSIRSEFKATRVGGKDRYDTNYKVLNYFKDCTDFKDVYVAKGSNFPDALSVTALAAKDNAPLVISSSHINKDTVKLAKNKGTDKLILIGGDSVTPDSLSGDFK